MILVDSSIWIDHLSGSNTLLSDKLLNGSVLTHAFIIGELCCGNIKNRSFVIELLGNLPQTLTATDYEVMFLIERKHLMGPGIGFIDAYLLASCLLDKGTVLWTRDKRLASVAQQLGVNYQ
jgi:predicted nucleic acid-binding protein